MVLLVLGTARRSPRRWPLWAGLAGALLTVLGSWVYPRRGRAAVQRVHARCPNGELRTDIMALAEKEQVPVSDVLVADASRRTTTLNAYVSGFGSTKRVVLYDNLVEDVPRAGGPRSSWRTSSGTPGTTTSWSAPCSAAVGVVLGSGLLGLVLGTSTAAGPGRGRAARANRRRWRCCSLLAAVGSLLASPVRNTASRAVEARADRSSLEATGDYAGVRADAGAAGDPVAQ